MTFDDFEDFFDTAVLQRAKSYYKIGAVYSLFEIEEGEWTAEVEGSEIYTVNVSVHDNEILECECDCPYDFGDFCKHLGAVLFALRDSRTTKKPGKRAANTTKRENLKLLIDKLSKEELAALILDLAKNDKRLKNELLLRCADKNDIIKYSRNVIKNSINSVKRQGFVEYGEVRKAVRGAEKVLDTIDEYLDKGDVLTAATLCTVVLEETVELLQYCDDSNGECGFIIDEALGKVGIAVGSIPKGFDKTEKLFDIIFNHAQSDLYQGWMNWQIDLMTALIPLCGNTMLRKKMDDYSLSNIEASDDNYRKEKTQNFRLELISRLDGEAAAEQYINDNIDNHSFRKRVILKALECGHYEKALKLCFDGESKAANLPGLLLDYMQMRFDIYGHMQNTEKQKELAVWFVLDGKFDYYEKLKSLCSENWAEVLKFILEKTKPKKRSIDFFDRFFGRNAIYEKILVAENLTAELLDYCKENIAAIVDNCERLVAEYPTEVNEIYTEYIFRRAAAASDRSAYKNICALIRAYKKALQKDITDIKARLTAQYHRKSAFIDELSRI